MARLDTSGIDGIIDELSRLGDIGQRVTDDMLRAGAEEVKKAWKDSADKHELRDTGDMINSIGPTKTKTTDGARSVDIYPQGIDRKGVRNAEKAFVHHYGTSSIPAKHWVDEAEEAAGPKSQAAMEKIYDDFLNGGK